MLHKKDVWTATEHLQPLNASNHTVYLITLAGSISATTLAAPRCMRKRIRSEQDKEKLS